MRLLERNRDLRLKLTKKYRHVYQLMRRVSQLESMIYTSQSGQVSDDQPPPGVQESEMAPMSKEQITSFADQDAGWVTEKVGYYDPTMDLANNSDSDLGNFLKRPIRQSAQTWIVGQSLFYKFNPWTAFCENPYVRDKIKNFQLLRMKLHVKMVISGTKFHYGRALVAYNPYTLDDQVTIDRDHFDQDLIAASQKPHIFLNPTKNTGGELSLPFFYPKNYFSIPEADWREMGEITMTSFGNLLHANGGNDPVTVTTYIWAEDVVLTVPTSYDPPLVSQSGRSNVINSGDEYGSGIVSKPAAAIAKSAGALSRLPIIGPYMTATQIGASAVGRIAQLFGYSRPNIITDTLITKPQPAGNLCNVDAADAAVKLTLDSKAELTVDSRTVGLDGSDEMGILDYCKRESFLTSFAWNPNTSADTMLWNSRVTPQLYDTLLDEEIHMTPLSHMATAFDRWQGSIKFRFQVVKSDFHKGRLLARWDPSSLTSEISYNTNYSRVIDIAETDDFEIVVGWGQAYPWVKTGEPLPYATNFSDAVRLENDTDIQNGILDITVLNDLTSPGIDAPIRINVFVSACDDFKLASPTNEKMAGLHLFKEPPGDPFAGTKPALRPEPQLEVLTSQSSVPNVETGDTTMSDKPTGPSEIMPIAKKAIQEDSTYLVYYGDPPSSIRELCKRYVFTRWWTPADSPENNSVQIAELINKDLPYHTGYDKNGVDIASDGTTQLTVGPTAFHSWFLPAYAGYRGGVRKKYYFATRRAKWAPVVTRGNKDENNNGYYTKSSLTYSTPRGVITKFLSSRWAKASARGAVATNLGVNDTIEVELPFYKPERFAAARDISAQTMQCNSHSVYIADFNDGSNKISQHIQQYDAVAEDFSLFFFTGVPIYYSYQLDETS